MADRWAGWGSAVLKWSEARGTWAQVVLAAEAKVAGARLHGYPTPAWVAAGLTARGFAYQVQEFLPGHPARYLTEPLARQVIDVLECCAAGRRPDPGGDPHSDWSHVSFGASLDGATGSSRAVDAEHRRLDRLEVPQG